MGPLYCVQQIKQHVDVTLIPKDHGLILWSYQGIQLRLLQFPALRHILVWMRNTFPCTHPLSFLHSKRFVSDLKYPGACHMWVSRFDSVHDLRQVGRGKGIGII